MTELDQIWSQMLEHAAARADNSGQSEIAGYIKLKAANDAVRTTGVNWLFDAMIEIAAETNRHVPAVTIERIDPHRFDRGNSNMVGSLVRVRQGVRCLTLEAGWTRTPNDGIMRNGALAAARVTHFGLRNFNADLALIYANELPLWHIESGEGGRTPFRIADLESHFRVLLGE